MVDFHAIYTHCFQCIYNSNEFVVIFIVFKIHITTKFNEVTPLSGLMWTTTPLVLSLWGYLLCLIFSWLLNSMESILRRSYIEQHITLDYYILESRILMQASLKIDIHITIWKNVKTDTQVLTPDPNRSFGQHLTSPCMMLQCSYITRFNAQITFHPNHPKAYVSWKHLSLLIIPHAN